VEQRWQEKYRDREVEEISRVPSKHSNPSKASVRSFQDFFETFADTKQETSDNIFDNLPSKKKARHSASPDELARYLAAPTVDVDDPIVWWIENATLYPRLSRMALDYLTIPGTSPSCPLFSVLISNSPATSTDVERVFSRGRILLSHIRNRLSAQSTRAIICLGSWSLLGLIHDTDIFNVTKLPEEPADPELEADEWEAVFADIEGEDSYNDRLDFDYD
jgi:hypothetical protein